MALSRRGDTFAHGEVVPSRCGGTPGQQTGATVPVQGTSGEGEVTLIRFGDTSGDGEVAVMRFGDTSGHGEVAVRRRGGPGQVEQLLLQKLAAVRVFDLHVQPCKIS